MIDLDLQVVAGKGTPPRGRAGNTMEPHDHIVAKFPFQKLIGRWEVYQSP
jgi:hypothetical protein